MLSLIQSTQKAPISKKNSNQSYVSSNLNGGMAAPTAASSGGVLPPKTVRQIKQRSVERQLTSSSILSLPKQTAGNTSAKSHSSESQSAFSEQNKSTLRKLSNSAQSLHNSDESEPIKVQSKLKTNEANNELLLIDQVNNGAFFETTLKYEQLLGHL